ncbi:MAG: hypothetical protein IJP12_01590 [Methanobrevibacter sp.]|nr:hypothetical protein [Methanobrevibacter sp.]
MEILSYTKSEKSKKELLKIGINLRRKIKNANMDKLRELKSVQQVMAKRLFNKKEQEKFMEEDDMQSIDLQEEALIMTIEYKMNKAYKEGEEKGVKKGEIKGEEKTKEEYVKNMIKKGMSTQTIKEITGLSKKEIERIKNKEKERQIAYA